MAFSFQLTSEESWNSIIKDIEGAKHSIELELFIVDVDSVGLLLINTLREKAKQGVKVRLLVDGGGSFLFYMSRLSEEIKAEGVEISFFNHVVPWLPKNLKLFYFRNHRRSIIIDNEIAYTGGVCFSSNMKGWRETTIKIDNLDAISEIHEAWVRMWEFSEHGKFKKRYKPTKKEWGYLTDTPVPRRRYLSKAFIELIKSSKKEIFLTTPYFVPDTKLMRNIKRAIKRGVSVSLLLPTHSNHPLVDRAGDFQKQELIKRGVKIYLYPHNMIHSKTAVFDDVGIVGSMNLDYVSLHYNFEGGLVVTNKECVNELKEQFLNDIKNLSPLTPSKWHNRPLKQRVLSYLMWPFQKLL
ncbi:MAG: phospholipase D-like domain-containing protein [Candidatus Paceibacterota bacterium]|jgi:cardiolipin synthase